MVYCKDGFYLQQEGVAAKNRLVAPTSNKKAAAARLFRGAIHAKWNRSLTVMVQSADANNKTVWPCHAAKP